MGRYVDFEDLKAYMGASQNVADALYEQMLARAERAIDVWCRRTFVATTATRAYAQHAERTRGAVLFVDDDLLSVTTLTNGTGEVIPSTGYWLEPRNEPPYGIIRLKASYVWNFSTDGEISVAGSWGYSATAPADIQQAAIRLAAFLFRQKDSNTDMDRPVLTGDGVTIMPSKLPADVMSLITPYRRPEVR